jgi:ParB/RepB/Spo0J family partition protein
MPKAKTTPPAAAPKPAAIGSVLTDIALDDDIQRLRGAGHHVERQGMHWRARIGDGELTVLTGDELKALARDLPLPAPTQLASPPPDAGASLLVDLAEIVDNPFQPRLDYDDERVTAIAKSIRESGLLQVPLARRVATDRYELAFGHTRLRAFAQLAKKDAARFGRMPLIVREMTDETMALHAWTENKDRKDLTAYEEARAIERYTTVFGWSTQQAAAKLHLDRSTVANKLRLLKLPQAAIEQLRRGALSERQAQALLPLAELPESLAKEQFWAGNVMGSVAGVNDLISKASAHDSTTLRQAVTTYLDRATIVIKDKPWRNLDVPGVRSASCSDCPIRLASSDRCPNKVCADLKERAWHAQQATAAAASVGLPTTACSGYSDHDDLRGVNLKAIREKAKEKGCGNLAVLFSPNSYFDHKIEGYKNCGIVCGHGFGKRCACKMALARSGNPAASQEAKERAERAKIKAELLGPAEQAAARALASATPAVWRTLLKQIDHQAESKLPKDANLAAIQAAIAAKLVNLATQYSMGYSPSFAGARKELGKLLGDLGAAPPWDGDATAAAVARQRIAEALDLAGHPMAPAFLTEARAAADQVADPAARAALLAEIEQAASVCTQTTTEQLAEVEA